MLLFTETRQHRVSMQSPIIAALSPPSTHSLLNIVTDRDWEWLVSVIQKCLFYLLQCLLKNIVSKLGTVIA